MERLRSLLSLRSGSAALLLVVVVSITPCVLSCDDPAKFTADLNGDGQIDQEDDPCCYLEHWTPGVCLDAEE